MSKVQKSHRKIKTEVSIGFIRRKLLTLAKAGSGRRLERETECDDGVNVKGQNRDRGSAH